MGSKAGVGEGGIAVAGAKVAVGFCIAVVVATAGASACGEQAASMVKAAIRRQASITLRILRLSHGLQDLDFCLQNLFWFSANEIVDI
jgi:hypothetical protein